MGLKKLNSNIAYARIEYSLSSTGNCPGLKTPRSRTLSCPHGWAAAIEQVGVPNAATGWEGVAEGQTEGDPRKEIFDAAYGSAADNPFNTIQDVLHFFRTGTF